MFKSKEKPETSTTLLETEIQNCIQNMEYMAIDGEDYEIAVNNLSELVKSKTELTKSKRIDVNTLLVVGGNLLGILFILGYEKADIVTSKALGFVLRGRV